MKNKRIITMLACLVAGVLMFVAAQPAAAQQAEIWTVEYFNSTNLVGAPVYTDQVASVGFNWTAGAPAPGVNADFFSARWTSVQSLAGGTYEIRTRADDGVRVFINNAIVINEFHTATNETYIHTFDVPAGQHVFRVEYYEGSGVAYLDFELIQVSPTRDQPLATVLAGRLNVRENPRVVAGNVLTQVTQNETYLVVGRTPDSDWWQILVDGVTGWVSGRWVDVLNAGQVPITGGETPPPGTAFTLTASYNLNVRNGPGTEYDVIEWLPFGESAPILGRNQANTWWQIRHDGVIGWVSAFFTFVPPELDVNDVPVTWTAAPTDTLTTTGNLNIRSGPGIQFSVVGWIPAGQTAEIIGRNADNSWWQIQYGGVTGWISAVYTQLNTGVIVGDIPITG
jgi:uncharacterized protein YraI